MDAIPAFEAVQVGQDVGTFEMTLDEETIKNKVDLVHWEAEGPAEKGFALPGITIPQHALMSSAALPEMRVSIWARSEHEFLRPMKAGGRIFIRGRIADKYVKRGRAYFATELETTDEAGEVLMRSRETGVWVE